MKNQLFLFVFMITSFGLSAQDFKQQVKCGDRIQASFKNNHELQSFLIDLDGGTNLKVNTFAKFGDHLKYNIQILAPSGLLLSENKAYKSALQIESGIVPGTGTYAVNPYNYPYGSHTGHLGDYVIEFTCITYEGEIISPDNQNSEAEEGEGDN